MIKTIDINCKEWFDKINGNSYFAGEVILNYGMDSSETFKIPFQYGYGSQYIHEGLAILKQNGCNVHYGTLKDYGIILRHNLQTGCKKKELTS